MAESIIEAYTTKFGETPPIFGYTFDEWSVLVMDALKTGIPMVAPETELPEDALI